MHQAWCLVIHFGAIIHKQKAVIVTDLEDSLTTSLYLTMLDVLTEDPELGVVLKCDEAAQPRRAYLFTNQRPDVSTDQSEANTSQ